jgi:hypothetical protein
MFCPNCGSKNSEAQKFCRSCGLGLEKIASSVAEQLPTKADLTLQQRKEKLERLGVAALSIFGLGVLSFILYLVFQKLNAAGWSLTAVLGMLAFIIVFGCGILSVILFAQAKDLKEVPASRRDDGQAQIPTTRTTDKLLESHQQPVFSVTDRTTELLKADRLTKQEDS